MNSKFISLIKVLFIFIMVFFMTSCWDATELDDFSFILGVGVDVTEEDSEDEFELTIQTARITQAKIDTSGSDESENYVNLTSTGKNIFYALREINHKYSRKPFLEQNYVIMFGDEMAQKGILPYLDLFIRDHETRMTVRLVVTKGKAYDALEVEPELEKIPAVRLYHLIENQEFTSHSKGATLLEFVQDLENKSKNPVATLVEITEEKGQEIVQTTGLAVFDEDKLIGELNKIETRGLLWVLNQVKSGIIEVETENGKGSVEIKKAKGKFNVKSEDTNNITVEISIFQEGNIGDMSGYEEMEVPDIAAEFEKRTEEVIKAEIESAFEKAKELKSDVFGIGDYIRRNNFKKWKTIEEQWKEIFPTVEIKIQVNSKIVSAGMVEILDKYKE